MSDNSNEDNSDNLDKRRSSDNECNRNSRHQSSSLVLSLAGLRDTNSAGMRENMHTNMPGLNHLRHTVPPINQSTLNSSLHIQHGINSGAGSSNNNNSSSMWLSGLANNNNNSSNQSINNASSHSGNLPFPVWGDMADSLLERGRSKNWTYEETMELINTYTSDEWQNKFSSEKKNHRAIWSEMAEVLKKREGVTGDEARQRLNNLKALYNRIRRQLIAGEIAAPQWEYWESLHVFLTRPSQYSGFGFPRESSPLRSGLSPPNHPSTTPPYAAMQHMPHLHRPLIHGRMGPPPPHMMHSSSSQLHHMSNRSHDMALPMPHFSPFKVGC